jgi:hypothetical protein
MVLSVLMVKLAAGRFPKKTPVALVKLLPVSVTVVPPAAVPEDGLTAERIGVPA